MMRAHAAGALLAALPLAAGHGAIVFPPSRNAIDGQLDPWHAGVPFPVIFNSTSPSCEGTPPHVTCTERPTYNAPQWCPIADSAKNDTTAPYDNLGLSGANGQACCESRALPFRCAALWPPAPLPSSAPLPAL